jgi:hypothetical protein
VPLRWLWCQIQRLTPQRPPQRRQRLLWQHQRVLRRLRSVLPIVLPRLLRLPRTCKRWALQSLRWRGLDQTLGWLCSPGERGQLCLSEMGAAVKQKESGRSWSAEDVSELRASWRTATIFLLVPCYPARNIAT